MSAKTEGGSISKMPATAESNRIRTILKDAGELAAATWKQWNAHNDQMLGAALAYYTVLSMAPLLILSIAVIGLAFSRQAAQGQIVYQLHSQIGTTGAQAIQSVIQSVGKPGTESAAGILGFCVLVYGSSSVFNALRDALNMIWGIDTTQIS